MWNKYGDEMTFEIVQVCERSELRILEQQYINSASGRLMNLAKEVCELASAESHAARMKNAWKKRTSEAKNAMSEKISATVKQRYAENPEFLASAQAALVKARAARAARPMSEAERTRRQDGARLMWVRRKARNLMI